jgi:hypothetical protein
MFESDYPFLSLIEYKNANYFKRVFKLQKQADSVLVLYLSGQYIFRRFRFYIRSGKSIKELHV